MSVSPLCLSVTVCEVAELLSALSTEMATRARPPPTPSPAPLASPQSSTSINLTDNPLASVPPSNPKARNDPKPPPLSSSSAPAANNDHSPSSDPTRPDVTQCDSGKAGQDGAATTTTSSSSTAATTTVPALPPTSDPPPPYQLANLSSSEKVRSKVMKIGQWWSRSVPPSCVGWLGS